MPPKSRASQIISGSLVIIATVAAVPFVISALFELRYRDDNSDLAPQHGAPKYMRSSEEAIAYDDSENPILVLHPGAKVYALGTMAGKTHIEVYGWIWSDSLALQGHRLTLAPNLGKENFRTQAQGDIVALVLNNAALENKTSTENTDWTFCRITGWINSSLLEDHPPTFGIPIITITSRRGGDPIATTIISENAMMVLVLVVVSLSFGIRLLMPGKLIGTDIFRQYHSGSGDNVAVMESHKMPSSSVFTIATKIANPLALSGFTLGAVYLLLRGVLQLGVFPKLTEQHGFLLLMNFVYGAFFLGLFALVVGLGAHVFIIFQKRRAQGRKGKVSAAQN